MLLQPLEFKYIAEGGKKPHYIFMQGDIFYVFTTMDREMRGNFQIIPQTEVDTVKWSLASKAKIPEEFACKDIYTQVAGIHKLYVKNKNIEDKEDPIITRLRIICYILVEENFLEMFKQGNAVYFRKLKSLIDQSRSLSKIEQSINQSVSQTSKSSLADSNSNKPLERIFLERILKDAINTNQRDDGWSHLVMVGQYLKDHEPSLNYKQYGCKNLTALIKTFNIFEAKPEDSNLVREKFKKAKKGNNNK